jgi:PAS domain S-box-containing protein
MRRALLLRYADLVFNSIPHAIFTVDEQCRITQFNQAAEEITGYTRAEVVGRHCAEVLRSRSCEGKCLLRDSMRAGEDHRDSETTILTRDGRPVNVAVSTAALEDGDGRVSGGVEMFRDLSEVTELRRRLHASYTVEDIVTKSAAMRGVREILPLVARSESTVLIEGEPGTGKEMVAKAIHNLGPRRSGPFVAVNCGAIPDTLVESELFGYVRGAFTDAKRDKPGRFALAQGGTLLLDEVGELSPAVQVKLLRVLQEREFTPLGAVRPVQADVRILAATNRDLAGEVRSRRFRQDLFFRLNIVRMSLPPLRDRTEDIPMLVQHFIARFNALQGRRIAGISVHAMGRLLSYSFPGNVRELENAIEHAFVVCCGDTIQVSDLPSHVRPDQGAALPVAEPGLGPLAGAEAATIREVLSRHGGNRSRAAEELGVSRNTLWRKIRRYNLE